MLFVVWAPHPIKNPGYAYELDGIFLELHKKNEVSGVHYNFYFAFQYIHDSQDLELKWITF